VTTDSVAMVEVGSVSHSPGSVLGQGSSLAESVAWTGSYGGTDVANGGPPHRAILRIHDPWSLIMFANQAGVASIG
jgi:hypothetical protein